ncbi:MAG: hypothetical protein EOP83_36590 [Verrucomicrobiaceae bacterium]|nr:MAG: hypothetical protein EOP83_36590 [Verrucomicrobiaceae bacterium]
MTPGPSLDGMIARRLWRALVFVDTATKTSYLIQQGDRARLPLPPYSTDLDEAHRVVRFMQNQGYAARIRHDPESGMYRACFTLNDGRVYVYNKAETMPAAICIAALLALDNKNIQ